MSKGGKHRPCPPASTPILEVLALLALLDWVVEGTENGLNSPGETGAWFSHRSTGEHAHVRQPY